MKKKDIKENSVAYAYAADSLKGLRPYFHTVSAVTTFAFIVGLLMAQQVVAGFTSDYPIASYSLCFLTAGVLAVIYEKKVSSVITAFGIVVSYGHSKRLVVAISTVCVPLVFIAGLTSYVGLNESAHQAYINEGGVTAGSIASLLSQHQKSTAGTMVGRQQAIIDTRNNQRETIIAEYANTWSRSKAAGRNDSLYIARLQIKALSKHDKETEKLLAKADKENMTFAGSQNGNIKRVLDDVAGQQAISKARWLWLGKTGGVIAIICLLLSTVASVTEQYIYRLLDMPPQLNGGFSLSPTLPWSANRGQKQVKTPNQVAPERGRGGEPEQAVFNYAALTNSVKQLNNARQAGGEVGDAAHVEMYDKIEQLNNEGYGVYFNENENIVTFDELNKPTLKI